MTREITMSKAMLNMIISYHWEIIRAFYFQDQYNFCASYKSAGYLLMCESNEAMVLCVRPFHREAGLFTNLNLSKSEYLRIIDNKDEILQLLVR